MYDLTDITTVDGVAAPLWIFDRGGFKATHGRIPTNPLPFGFAANTILFAAALGAPWYLRALRRRWRIRRGRCGSCGYLLEGLSRCPECGQEADARHARHATAAVAMTLLLLAPGCGQRPETTGVRQIIPWEGQDQDATSALQALIERGRAGEPLPREALAALRFSGDEPWTVRIEGMHEARRATGVETLAGFLAFEDMHEFTYLAAREAREAMDEDPETGRRIAIGIAELGALLLGLTPDPDRLTHVVGVDAYNAGLTELLVYYRRFNTENPVLDAIDAELDRASEIAAEIIRATEPP